MQVTAWTVLVPLALASLVTGLLQSLTTRWGLFRHYWVVVKQLIAVLATAVLLMYTETLGYLGELPPASTASGGDVSGLRNPSPVLHAGAALLLLVVAAMLSVYNPGV